MTVCTRILYSIIDRWSTLSVPAGICTLQCLQKVLTPVWNVFIFHRYRQIDSTFWMQMNREKALILKANINYVNKYVEVNRG